MNTARTLLFLGAALLLVAGTRAQGPDEKGAVLVGGFGGFGGQAPASQPSTPQAQTPRYANPPLLPAASDRSVVNKFFPEYEPFDGSQIQQATLASLEEKPDINRDIQITPKDGAWVIFLIGCAGDDGPEQARKWVQEMRTNPAYRFPAHVFYYGAEERRKENERVKKLIAEQMEFFRQNKFVPDEPIKIKHRKIDVQYAVLLGGYSDRESAKTALERMRHLPVPDSKKVNLEGRFWSKPGTNQSYVEYVSPFLHAFACKNPSVKEQNGPMSKEEAIKELAEVRGLNADESYSLFNCKRAVTLAVKGFQTPSMMKGQETTTSIMGSKGLRSDGIDRAKLDAHQLAETLRKLKLEAYVLHTSFSSLVTVGGFDSIDDPALKSMQEMLARKLNEVPYSQIQFFQQPVPMPVPR
jgi:hypothetical protein